MKNSNATRVFHALGREERLEIFELILTSRDVGICPLEISKNIQIPRCKLSSQLKILSAAGLVNKLVAGYTPLYFPNGVNIDQFLNFMNGPMSKSDAAKALQALSEDTRLRMFRLIRKVSQEGIVPKVISAELDIEYVLMLYHLDRLLDAGLIEKKGGWGSSKFFPSERKVNYLFTHLNYYLS